MDCNSSKNLQVSLDASGLCSRFEELSNEPIVSVPFANAAIVAGNVTGVVALVNGGTGATTAAGARANLGIENVDNTSDLNKPISTATKNYIDSQLTSSTIVDADATTKGKLQLAGDLSGTAAAPTVPGLALKENIANKSTDIVADAASTTKYPSVKVIKDYVDALNAAAGVADGSITSAKIADATIVNADVAANAQIDFNKLNIQKSNILGLGIVKGDLGLGNVDNTSDAAKPVSTATQAALDLKANAVDLAAEVTRATAAEATLTTNVTANATAIAAETTRATAAEATLTTNLAAEVTRATAAEALKAPLASPTFTGTVSGITQTMVGLSNVDNTSDANKPVSTATQTALDLKENLANKSTDITTDAASTTKYPSVKLIKDYVDASVSSGAPDATTVLKGKIKLAGDLTGTADLPTIATDAVTSTKIKDGEIATADIATAAITYAKIQNVAADKVLGRVSANAPETQAISFGTSLGKKLGFGMTVINDQTFIEKQTFVSLDFSYKLKMSETADVYFGIKAGGSSYNANTLGLETYNVQSDPALAAISTFNPNVGVGALYKEGPMYVSLSIPRLLNTKKATNDAGYASVATDSPHIFLSGGYDVPLDGELSTFILKPSAMLRYVSGAPVSLDLTAMLQIDKIVELGGMYRTDKAYAAMATVVISKRLVFGFAYEMSARPELARARNTNEMLLQFRF